MRQVTGEWRLGHRPALDGLRGVAILLVVLAHGDAARFGNLGRSGVTAFFTLSGFLITSLLLQAADDGNLSLRRFYLRRAHRLMPAAVVMLAVVVPLQYALDGEGHNWWTVPLEVSNWVSATYGPESMGFLHHTWSLSIEEQFYVLWPAALLTVLAVTGRRGVVALAATGIIGSVVAQVVTHGDRASFGTDTNASSLLLGCLLAALIVGRRPAVAPRGLWVAGLALIVLAPPLAAVGAAMGLWSAATRNVAVLAVWPLRAAGRISYGWYLWSYPLTLLVMRFGWSPWGGAGLSLGAACLSWRYVEQRGARSAKEVAGDGRAVEVLRGTRVLVDDELDVVAR
jgi:peptidoglycan/LPS O-acetylase OafA/YrhL